MGQCGFGGFSFYLRVWYFSLCHNILGTWTRLITNVLFAVSMMANQALMPVGMVLGINTMMGLNLHNAYSMDAVSYLDSSFGMVMGVLVSLVVIDVVRYVTRYQCKPYFGFTLPCNAPSHIHSLWY